jgi:uncharacterized protein
VAVTEAPASPDRLQPPTRTRRSKTSVGAQKWTRIIHVYTSMLSLLVVLFFAITGVTLNHPDWTFGGKLERVTTQGQLPGEWNAGGKVDWFVVAEHMRAENNVHGSVAEKDGDVTDASITFKGPAYQADAFIKEDGTYELNVETQGAMAVINDLHKGRNTTASWRWLIDVSGIGLTIVALTGIFLQFFLRKRRRAAFVSAGVGAVILVALAWIATS